MEKKTKNLIKSAYVIVMLAMLYIAGLPLYLVLPLGAFALLMITLRGHIYAKIEHHMRHLFPSLKKINPRVEKVIFVIIFILALIIFKQLIFFILKQFGIDVQRMMIESMQP